MEIEKLYKKYNLKQGDIYNHKHYTIITRQGIEKIQAMDKISISYDAISTEPEFCAVKAIASKGDAKIETFGSAKYGAKIWEDGVNGSKGKWKELGNTTSWYLLEIAEKRAMSRAVLKITGLYEHGFYGEDESEDFTAKKSVEPVKKSQKVPSDKDIEIGIAKTVLESSRDLEELKNNYTALSKELRTATFETKEKIKNKFITK